MATAYASSHASTHPHIFDRFVGCAVHHLAKTPRSARPFRNVGSAIANARCGLRMPLWREGEGEVIGGRGRTWFLSAEAYRVDIVAEPNVLHVSY